MAWVVYDKNNKIVKLYGNGEPELEKATNYAKNGENLRVCWSNGKKRIGDTI